MKFSFSKGDPKEAAPQQQPVQQDGQILEPFGAEGPSKLKIALITLGILALLFIIYAWWMSGRVYARGIVASQNDVYNANYSSRVGDIHVQPGDSVSSGDPLFELISDEANSEFKQLAEKINQQELIIQDIDPKQPVYSKLYDQGQIDSIHAAKLNIDKLKLQYEQESRREDLGENDRKTLRSISLLQKQSLHHKRLLNEKEEQLKNIQLLAKLDAANAVDVNKAEQEVRAARINFESAKINLDTAEENMVSGRQDRVKKLALLHKQLADAENHFNVLKKRFDAIAKQEYERINSEIRRLTIRSEKLQDAAGPKMFIARNAGVVKEVTATPGALVSEKSVILNIATTDAIWVEAYVPTEDASILDKEETPAVSVLSRIHNQRFNGHFIKGSDYEDNVPPEIYNTDRSNPRAIKVRIDIESHGSLTPGNIVDVIFH